MKVRFISKQESELEPVKRISSAAKEILNQGEDFEETIKIYLKGRDEGMSPQDIAQHIFNVSLYQF